jgi:hypothetical protein
MEAHGFLPIPDGSNPRADRKPDAVVVICLCGSLSTSLPETRIVAIAGEAATVIPERTKSVIIQTGSPR